MATNRGKQFETAIKESFLKVPNVSVDRLHDQMTGFKVTSANICDFIVYREPYEYYIECKSVHGNTLPFTNISDNQWNGLLEKSKIKGVYAGVICWWIDKNVTKWISIDYLQSLKTSGYKSIRFDITEDSTPPNWADDTDLIDINGKKKRVFYDYDMKQFFENFEWGLEYGKLCD